MENWLRDNPEGGSNHEYSFLIYYKNAAARRVAVMIGSILSMSRYAECREDVSLRQYKRILLVLTEKQAVQPLAEIVQYAEPDTTWGLIVIGDNELSVQRRPVRLKC